MDAFGCICPSFTPPRELSWFSYLSIFTLLQKGHVNSKPLVCDCRNKYQQWEHINFKINLLVFTVIIMFGWAQWQKYFMPGFNNHWIFTSVATALWVIFHPCTLTTTAPCFQIIVSNTEIACENYFSCHFMLPFLNHLTEAEQNPEISSKHLIQDLLLDEDWALCI